jgi:putative ABC transport system permease protein
MRIFRYSLVAAESILAHKLRAILTMLGIIIGVAAVVTTIGIGRGVADDIAGQFESGGSNLVLIFPSLGASNTLTLTEGDATALSNQDLHPAIKQAVPSFESRATIVYNDTNLQVNVVGAPVALAEVRNLEPLIGRFLNEEEVAESRRVTVLGYQLARDLFGNTDPIGLQVRINNDRFTIIGVLEQSGGFSDTDNQAFVPLPVAQSRVFAAPRYRGDYAVTTISIQVTGAEQMEEVEAQIETTLRFRHNLGPDDENDFTIFNQADLLELAAQIGAILTAFLGSIGAISLLVGGIGIMNIMLVSVTERTREIGLRKAVGAHNRDILLQFLIEAVMLCALGGTLGVGLSYGVALFVQSLPEPPFSVLIQADSLLLALGVSVASGIIFGLYPAFRATRLDPIEALRYE